jgi:hypothetical protein
LLKTNATPPQIIENAKTMILARILQTISKAKITASKIAIPTVTNNVGIGNRIKNIAYSPNIPAYKVKVDIKTSCK